VMFVVAIYFDWGIFLLNKNSQKNMKYDKEITTYGVSLSSGPLSQLQNHHGPYLKLRLG